MYTLNEFLSITECSTMAFFSRALSLTARNFSAAQQTRTFVNNMAVKKWAFNLSGFNQYGLYHDDVLYESDDVKEAIRRLPQNLQDERAFRIQRALQVQILSLFQPPVGPIVITFLTLLDRINFT